MSTEPQAVQEIWQKYLKRSFCPKNDPSTRKSTTMHKVPSSAQDLPWVKTWALKSKWFKRYGKSTKTQFFALKSEPPNPKSMRAPKSYTPVSTLCENMSVQLQADPEIQSAQTSSGRRRRRRRRGRRRRGRRRREEEEEEFRTAEFHSTEFRTFYGTQKFQILFKILCNHLEIWSFWDLKNGDLWGIFGSKKQIIPLFS